MFYYDEMVTMYKLLFFSDILFLISIKLYKIKRKTFKALVRKSFILMNVRYIQAIAK